MRKLPRKAGEPPFAEGERDDAIYLLGEGSNRIVVAARTQRLGTVTPGMRFG
ncbi:MAG: hypothetical protein N2688_11705 [Burkholderiaceae bacterium]|nr:hypothetical protein [Burkholderiaceae bacterium]